MIALNIMKIALVLPLLALGSFLSVGRVAAADTRFYELRTYTAAPGKMEALQRRFREHTLALFEKHGMQNIGYWTELDKENHPTDQLTYLLAYPSREGRETSWKAFMADKDWQAAYKASEADGRLVSKVQSRFHAPTDYSPEIQPSKVAGGRVFELRIYKTPPGRLDALNARFRDHTVKLFDKHGLVSFGYWNPVDEKDGAKDTLVYILAHKSRAAAAENFREFGKDPDWVAARKESEQKAGGSLTVAEGGVRSTFMTPTDYSPTQ